MRTHTLLIVLALATTWSGCKERSKSEPLEPPKTGTSKMKAPVSKAMSQPTKVTSPTKNPAKRPPRDDTKWLISQSDKLNKCIHTFVVDFRSALEKPKSLKSYVASTKKSTARCTEILLKTLQADLNITAPLKHYYVLAAATIDTWNDILPRLTTDPAPRVAALSSFDARVSKSYNTFALRNNDLQGAPLLLPDRPRAQGTLDLRTYSDELARLGETAWNNLHTWHINHELPPKAVPPFRKHVLRERVALRLMERIVERHGAAFSRLQCVAGFTRPQGAPAAPTKGTLSMGTPAVTAKKSTKEVTCAVLKQQGEALTKAWRGYITFWRGLLRTPPETLPETAHKSAIALYKTLKDVVQALPPRVR